MEKELIWEEYGLGEVERGFEELFPEASFSVEELWDRILEGNIVDGFRLLGEEVVHIFWGQALAMKEIFVYLLVLGIVGALLCRFVEIFDQNQVADLCYYVIYLTLGALLLKCYENSAGVAAVSLENMVLFIKLLVPTFLLALGVAGKTLTVSAYSVILLLIIYVVEHLLLIVLMGGIHVYAFLALLNGIWKEEKLDFLMELLGRGVSFVLKELIAFVSGLSLLQGMITPMLDGMKSGVITKVVSFVPGIGAGTESVTKMVLGSALIVKNSVGVLLLILLLFLCISPLIQLLCMTITLKCGGALLSFLSDKRMVRCASGMGEGSFMLFKTLATAMLLFMISLTLVASSTNVIL